MDDVKFWSDLLVHWEESLAFWEKFTARNVLAGDATREDEGRANVSLAIEKIWLCEQRIASLRDCADVDNVCADDVCGACA
jgi:hypothetical protein